jgi:outer membrane lipoprotein-sorting protein
MIRVSLLAAALLGLVPLAVPAQDARDVLIHSLEQESRVSYAGYQTTVVTDGGRARRAAQIVKRLAPNRLRIEYLAPSHLKGELVVDDGTRLRRSIPALRVVEEGPSRLQRSLQRHRDRIRDLREGKRTATLVGESSLLGRPVTIVQLAPSKPDRPTRTLWLDRATGVALRVEEKSPGGRTSVTSFERITFEPVLGDAEFHLEVPAGFTIVPAHMGRPISLQHANELARRLWGGLPMPAQVPAGFALTSAHELSFHQHPVIALRYTRGADALSLFVSDSAGEPFSAPVQPHVNVYQYPLGRVLVTLVGSPSPAQLSQIAASIRLPDEPGVAQTPVVNHSHPR